MTHRKTTLSDFCARLRRPMPKPCFRMACSLLALSLVGMCAPRCYAVSIYADFVDEVQNVTYYGSGSLTGAPDGSGAFLSSTFDPPSTLGHIVVRFSPGIVDGAGVDLQIHDCCAGSAPTLDEKADVFVSNDGAAFTLLGAYGIGSSTFDFNGVFASTVHYVKIVNTATMDSPDIDAFEGRYVVPEPATCTLALFAAASLVRRSRR